MNISPYQPTRLIPLVHLARSSSRSRLARHAHLLCALWAFTSLVGCMRVDQEVDRDSVSESHPTAMERPESESTPNDQAELGPLDDLEPETSEPEPGETETSAPETSAPETSTPETSAPETPETETLEICAPEPLLYRDRWSVAPRLKDWVDELIDLPCSLEGQDLAPSINQLRGSARFGAWGEESCDLEGCWVTLPSAVKTWYESPDDRHGFLESGELWTGVIDARYHLESGVIEAYLTASQISHNALREVRRRWDAEGHILSDRNSFNGQLWSDVTYTWTEGQIAHIDSRDYINGSAGYRFEFTYDTQDRLSVAHVSSGAQESESRWSYDSQDRPVSVVHLTSWEGALRPWLHQSWIYDDEGALSAHINLVNMDGVEIGMNSHLTRFASLTSYQPASHMSQYDWDRQAARVSTLSSGESCFALPSGVEIGYPASARVYDLGWPAHLRPEGIDIEHGFQRIYRVGMLGWMSHFGAQGEHSPVISYLGLARQISSGDLTEPHQPIVMRSVIRYEGLNATSEELSAYSPDEAQVSERAFVISETAEASVISRRQRDWREGQLVRDSIELDDVVRTFEFTYDSEGRITERTLYRDEALIARYTWGYHPSSSTLPVACQIARYELGYLGEAINEFWPEVIPIMNDEEPDPSSIRDDEVGFDTRSVYTATLRSEALGRCDQYHLSGPQGFELELSFDERGRLTRQRGQVSLSPFRLNQVEVTYHPHHDQVTSMLHLDAEGDTTRYGYEYEFDEDGKLIAHSVIQRALDGSDETDGEAAVTHHENFIYGCR